MPAAATLPEITSVKQAQRFLVDQFQKIQELEWQVAQLKKQLYGPSSERQKDERLSKEFARTAAKLSVRLASRRASLEYIPAKIIRHEIVCPKLACPCGQGGVSIAPLPPEVIEQGQAGASLVAHVILTKYDDHLPLYRQQQQFLRLGANLLRQTPTSNLPNGGEGGNRTSTRPNLKDFQRKPRKSPLLESALLLLTLADCKFYYPVYCILFFTASTDS